MPLNLQQKIHFYTHNIKNQKYLSTHPHELQQDQSIQPNSFFQIIICKSKNKGKPGTKSRWNLGCTEKIIKSKKYCKNGLNLIIIRV